MTQVIVLILRIRPPELPDWMHHKETISFIEARLQPGEQIEDIVHKAQAQGFQVIGYEPREGLSIKVKD